MKRVKVQVAAEEQCAVLQVLKGAHLPQNTGATLIASLTALTAIRARFFAAKRTFLSKDGILLLDANELPPDPVTIFLSSSKHYSLS